VNQSFRGVLVRECSGVLFHIVSQRGEQTGVQWNRCAEAIFIEALLITEQGNCASES